MTCKRRRIFGVDGFVGRGGQALRRMRLQRATWHRVALDGMGEWEMWQVRDRFGCGRAIACGEGARTTLRAEIRICGFDEALEPVHTDVVARETATTQGCGSALSHWIGDGR